MRKQENVGEKLHHQPPKAARREYTANTERSGVFPQGEFTSPEKVKSLGGPRTAGNTVWGGGENYHCGVQADRDGGMRSVGVFSGRRRLRLQDGRTLRLLSAMEVLEARREAETLGRDGKERALCSNACLLAKALERRGRPVFRDGEAVLNALRVEEIEALAERWGRFNREENPSVLHGEKVVSALKKAWSTRRMSG